MKPAICTQCGGTIEIDETKESGVCKYCSTPFITERVINNYITKTSHHVTENVTKIVYGQEKDEGGDFFRRALTLLELEEYVDACDALRKAVKLSPQRAEYWFYRVLAESKNLTSTTSFFHDEYDRSYGCEEIYTCATRFFKLATEEDKASLFERFGLPMGSAEELAFAVWERAETKDDRLFEQIAEAAAKEKNAALVNRIYRTLLEADKTGKGWDRMRGIGMQGPVARYLCFGSHGLDLLTEETLALLKAHNKHISTASATNGYATVVVGLGFYGDEVIRPVLPPDVKNLSLTCGNEERRFVLPAQLEGLSISMPKDAHLTALELEGEGVSKNLLQCVLHTVSPTIVYLPPMRPCTMARRSYSKSSATTVLVSDTRLQIQMTDAYGKLLYTYGGIFGGEVVYPKMASMYELQAFHENVKKHFAKELASGEITGLASDEDIAAGITPKPAKKKGPGFFARLFGKG